MEVITVHDSPKPTATLPVNIQKRPFLPKWAEEDGMLCFCACGLVNDFLWISVCFVVL